MKKTFDEFLSEEKLLAEDIADFLDKDEPYRALEELYDCVVKELTRSE